MSVNTEVSLINWDILHNKNTSNDMQVHIVRTLCIIVEQLLRHVHLKFMHEVLFICLRNVC